MAHILLLRIVMPAIRAMTRRKEDWTFGHDRQDLAVLVTVTAVYSLELASSVLRIGRSIASDRDCRQRSVLQNQS